MTEAQESLKRLLELLEAERREEYEQHQRYMQSTPLAQRVKDGYSWYPVEVRERGFGLGEYPFLVLHRTKELGKRHQFNPGNLVSVFSTEMEEGDQEPAGAVHWVDGDRMRVSFFQDELPDFLRSGRIGINLRFDERSFREMKAAVDFVLKSKNNRVENLREILLGTAKPSFLLPNNYEVNPDLNDSQNAAIENILSAEDVAVIHGPPGTGKTTTVIAAAIQILQQESQILVCAPSNAASDLLTERLAEKGVNVIRIGNLSRIDESVISNTLEYKLANSTDMKTVKEYRKRAVEFRRMAGKYKRHFGRAEREQRKQLRNEADSLIKDARRVEEQIVSGLLNNAQAIVTTLVGAVNHFLRERTFSTIIIDEAAQALEPATWIPISKADRVIFAGDPFQLPPTVKSREAELGGLSKTLVEKQLDLGRPVNLLDRQYRMNKLIMGFSNEWFYEGKLVADETVSDWTLMSVAGPIHPMEFVDTAGLNYEESQDQESMSFENPDEFRLIRTHLLRLAGELSDEEEPTVGIISPYRQQVRYMKEAVAKDALLSEIPNLVVNTIDSFQGQERDIIYISLVRSNSRNEIGFLSDYRRMNVAMTRAKKKLVMIGDSATLGGHEFYDKLLEYCDKTGSYRSAWELVTE